MKTALAVVFLVLAMTSVTLADGYSPLTEGELGSAFANLQQVGDFYFVPFPPNYYFGNGSQESRSVSAQAVLTVLAEFEKRKKLTIVSFEVQRDQTAHIHGILVKAVPPAKK